MTTSIAPLLSVRRGAQALAFYKAAFGAVELHKVESPDGEVVAQLAVDDPYGHHWEIGKPLT